MEAIVPIIILAAAFYLLIARPWMLRNRRAADLKEHLRPGVEIITTSGFLGKVKKIDGEEIHLELAPGVQVRLLFGAVGKILHTDSATQKSDKGGTGSGSSSTSN